MISATFFRRALHRLNPVAAIRHRIEISRLQWLTRSYSIGEFYERVYHYHIRKTAGTSLNAAFWGLAGLDLKRMGRSHRIVANGLIFVRHSRSLIENGLYFFANSHNPAHTISLPPKTFTITILRDPVKRLLSHYRYLHWARASAQADSKDPSASLLIEESRALGDTFADFVENLPKEDLLKQLFMFSSTFDVAEAAERIAACSAVCRTESFSDDIATLREALHLPLLEKRERQFQQKVRFSDEDRALAREVLAVEYDLIERVEALHSQTISATARI